MTQTRNLCERQGFGLICRSWYQLDVGMDGMDALHHLAVTTGSHDWAESAGTTPTPTYLWLLLLATPTWPTWACLVDLAVVATPQTETCCSAQ